MSLFGIKTVAAAKRGLEAGVSAGVGYLAATYLALGDDMTGSGLLDVIEQNGDKAIGVGIATLLVTFGFTRSPAPNISPVAENVPPPDGPLIDVKDDNAVADAEADPELDELGNPKPRV